MKNATKLIQHHLGRALPILSKHYKNATWICSQNTPNILQKSDQRKAFYLKNNPKTKVSWLGPI